MTAPFGPTVVGSCQEVSVTTTNSVVLTYTPPEPGNYLLHAYFRVASLVTGQSGALRYSLEFEDASGARSYGISEGFYGYNPGGLNSSTGDVTTTISLESFVNSQSGDVVFKAYNTTNSGTIKVSAVLIKL